MKKNMMLLYGLVAYLIFLGSFLYLIGFLADAFVPKTVDSGAVGPWSTAFFVDLLVLTVFSLQHSVMARPGFKKWWAKIVPTVIERSTYVLLSSLALVLIFWQWQPIPAIVWKVENPTLSTIVYLISGVGWAVVLLSTLMINHLELFGLKQVYENLVSRRSAETPFTVNIFYGIVRHPLMLGFLIAFWATPVMTLGHLLYTLNSTIYILVAVKFLEERDLEKLHGAMYAEYKQRVPMLIPFLKK